MRSGCAGQHHRQLVEGDACEDQLAEPACPDQEREWRCADADGECRADAAKYDE